MLCANWLIDPCMHAHNSSINHLCTFVCIPFFICPADSLIAKSAPIKATKMQKPIEWMDLILLLILPLPSSIHPFIMSSPWSTIHSTNSQVRWLMTGVHTSAASSVCASWLGGGRWSGKSHKRGMRMRMDEWMEGLCCWWLMMMLLRGKQQENMDGMGWIHTNTHNMDILIIYNTIILLDAQHD